MYKIIIVEDEDIIRKGLIYSTHWEEMHCSIVGEARNGIEGIEQIKKKEPDIVIADINMPVMGGLEMLKQTYQEYFYAAIILSGYSEFEYARNAISYGVTEYLLKPLKKADLEKAIKKATEKCDIHQNLLLNHKQSQEMKGIRILSEFTQNQKNDQIVNEMLHYIDQHYMEKIIFEQVAHDLSYSETFLSQRFKKQMGTTFNEYLNRYRIQKAIDIIVKEDFSLRDVAWMVGIQDYKYFHSVFKKYVGFSPKEFLAKIT